MIHYRITSNYDLIFKKLTSSAKCRKSKAQNLLFRKGGAITAVGTSVGGMVRVLPFQ